MLSLERENKQHLAETIEQQIFLEKRAARYRRS